MDFLIISIFSLFILFYIFVFLVHKKIGNLEKKIIQLFNEKNSLIPSLFEITQDCFVKHDDIFHSVLNLRKQSFSENSIHDEVYRIVKTQEQIHYELNFIFQVCNKHQKLLKNGNFLYIRDLIIEKCFDIGKNIELYKRMSKKYNTLIYIKNFTVIGALVPIYQKVEL